MATNASPGADAREDRAIVGTDSKTRQKRFQRLADAMVLVMQHSATPNSSLIACREVAQIVADQADLPTTF